MDPDRTAFLRVMARVAAAFDAVGVEYVFTGSVAAGFFGTPRFSADIDVVINATVADRVYVTKVLTEDFFADADVIRQAFTERSMFNVVDKEEHVNVDVMFWSRALNPGDIFARHREADVEGTRVKLISPEDLIIAKLLWAKDSHSEMQMRDVHGLLHYPKLDREDVRRNAARLGVAGLLEEASGERYAT